MWHVFCFQQPHVSAVALASSNFTPRKRLPASARTARLSCMSGLLQASFVRLRSLLPSQAARELAASRLAAPVSREVGTALSRHDVQQVCALRGGEAAAAPFINDTDLLLDVAVLPVPYM